MKRSEIINMIRHILDSVNPSHANTPYILLDSLENAGMLPPPSIIINPDRYGDDCFTIEVEYRGQDVSKEFPFETWEPELPVREETGQ